MGRPGNTLTWEAVQPILDSPIYPPVLTVGLDGNIYETSFLTVFRIDAAGIFSTIHDFASSGETSMSRLVVGQDGLLYGFTGKVNSA